MPDVEEDMKRLKSRDRRTYREIEKLFDLIEVTPDLGYELRGVSIYDQGPPDRR